MKKIIRYFCCVISLMILVTGMIACTSKSMKTASNTVSNTVTNAVTNAATNPATNTADNDRPEALYNQDNGIDLLVYQGTAYVNAVTVDWVTSLELKKDTKLGVIERTNVTKQFKDFDATLLDTGTEIYSVLGRKDIVLVNINNMMIPYLKQVEG